MDLQLHGRSALVTGSTKGIGAGIARCLAREGVSVMVHGRNAADGTRIVDSIRAEGGDAHFVAADIGSSQDVERMCQDTAGILGKVDILINNAANWDLQSWWDSPPEKWARLLDEQVVSLVRMTQLLVPAMRERGWGRVINISSGGATMPWSAGSDYHAAKAAIINMTVTLAQNLVGSGVNVTTVSPGPIWTPGLEVEFRKAGRAKGWPEAEFPDFEPLERRAASYDGGIVPNPTGRIGRPDDIGTICTFLASPLAGFINGANVRVDGGYIRCVN